MELIAELQDILQGEAEDTWAVQSGDEKAER